MNFIKNFIKVSAIIIGFSVFLLFVMGILLKETRETHKPIEAAKNNYVEAPQVAEVPKVDKEKIISEVKDNDKKISNLKKKFSIKKDNVEKIEFIKHLSNNYKDPFYIYLGSNNDSPWIRLTFNYIGDDWIFFEQAIVVADDERTDFLINKYDKTTDVWSGGTVYEHLDIRGEDYLSVLDTISKSKNTILRLSGKYRKDFTLTKRQKLVLKETLELYYLMKANETLKESIQGL